jgi:outer membrane lipoprotein-sorting protein
MKIGFIVLVLVACATTPAFSQAPPERLLGGVTVREVLRHAALAPRIVDYEGTKVLSVLRGALMETVTINEAHKRPSKTRLEFLSPEGVAGRLVIDDGQQVWHYEPRLNTVFVGPSQSTPTDSPAVLPESQYNVTLLGVEDVIGRATAVVSVSPRQGGRERRMWIDRTTGVALRTEDRDPDDGLVVTAYFTRISFGLNLPAALFRPHLPAGARILRQPAREALQPVAVLERTVGFQLRVPQTLDGGFSLQGGTPVSHGPLRAAHLRYSDGARTLSLFVAPGARVGPPGRGDPVPQLGSQSRTMIIGGMRLLQWESQGTRYTLVGPLPLSEMIDLAIAVSGQPR